MTEHGYTSSSPCTPDVSGEIIKGCHRNKICVNLSKYPSILVARQRELYVLDYLSIAFLQNIK